jgi:hypothetical protein
MFRYAALGFALFVVCSTPSLAQDMKGTPEEQAACRSDVRKLCRGMRPGMGPGTVLGCLQLNRERLSRTCSRVLSSHGQ